MSIATVFLIIAFICFVLAALNVPVSSRTSIGWLGVAIVMGVYLFSGGVLHR
jgi:hypothetical protein